MTQDQNEYYTFLSGSLDDCLREAARRGLGRAGSRNIGRIEAIHHLTGGAWIWTDSALVGGWTLVLPRSRSAQPATEAAP